MAHTGLQNSRNLSGSGGGTYQIIKKASMKKNRISRDQIITAINQNRAGRKAKDIAAELQIDTSTFYYWRKKYDLFGK